MNRMPHFTLIAAALAVPVGTTAQDAKPRVTIEGTSTVRDWQCTVPTYRMSLQPPAGFSEPVLRGEKALEDLQFVIDVRSIDCGIDKMNQHMLKALMVDEHPRITFDLALYDLVPGRTGMTAAAKGALTIAGNTRTATLQVELARGEHGELRAKGEHVIDMTDHGVKPPSLMLGTLKVGPRVTVAFDVAVDTTSQATALGGGLR